MPSYCCGTPGRILALTRDRDLSLKNVRHFILVECDKMLESMETYSIYKHMLKIVSPKI